MAFQNNILATVGLVPEPSGGITLTSDRDGYNIACYDSFRIQFVPPFSQFSIANANLNTAPALQNITGKELYTGSNFSNQVVMAPIQATARYISGITSFSLEFRYPDADTKYPGYNPIPPFRFAESVDKGKPFTEGPAGSQLNYTLYKIKTPDQLQVPGIRTDTNALCVYDLVSYYDIALTLYSTTVSINSLGVKKYTFTPISLSDIASSNAALPYPITIILMMSNPQNILTPPTRGDDFFLYNPSVLNQSTIPENDFQSFLTQVYANLSPALATLESATYSSRVLGVLYFDQFSTSNPQSINCVMGQVIFNTSQLPSPCVPSGPTGPTGPSGTASGPSSPSSTATGTSIYPFENTFNGYSFSFALTLNTTTQAQDTVVLTTLSDDKSYCLPYYNQFLLEPFGNSNGAFKTNNPTAAVPYGDSMLDAKMLSSYFGVAMTPGTFTFDCTADRTSATPKVTFNYTYPVTTDTSTCPLIQTVTFTYDSANATTLAKSSTQDIYVPYWTTEQIGNTGACYPKTAKIKVCLEADSNTQKLFNRLLTINAASRDSFSQGFSDFKQLVGLNPGVDDASNAFPILYLTVVVTDYGDLPSTITRPYALSNIVSENLNIVHDFKEDGTGVGDIVYSTIASSVVQNTETIGILVFSNLLYTQVSSNLHIYMSSPSSLTFGSFPTTQGVINIKNNSDVINDGDVVIIEAKFENRLQEGNFMLFKWLNSDKKKVPSMAKTPDAKYSLWQIVQLDANGNMVHKDKDTTNTAFPIAFDSYVGFYAFNCSSTLPDPVTCGWLSAKSCGGTNCYPYMNGNNGGPCEAWKLVNKAGGSETNVLDNTYLGILSSPNNNCNYPNQWLTNGNLEYVNPPTLVREDYFDTKLSFWRFNRVLRQQPLPK